MQRRSFLTGLAAAVVVPRGQAKKQPAPALLVDDVLATQTGDSLVTQAGDTLTVEV